MGNTINKINAKAKAMTAPEVDTFIRILDRDSAIVNESAISRIDGGVTKALERRVQRGVQQALIPDTLQAACL